jgi:hypothetical protein
MEWLAVLEHSALAQAVATAPHVYPLLSAAHILGMATLFGAILTVDLRLMGMLSELTEPALPTLTRLALVGFALAAVTGALLMLPEPVAYLANPAFQAKMALIAASGLLAITFVRGGVVSRSLAGASSLILWTLAVIAGRYIAFVP